MRQIPYLLVVGDQEIESASVSVRHRKDGDLGAMSIGDFIEKAQAEVASREIK